MVCAHGGDNAQAPPNTMRAFRAAVDGGVRCLEVRQDDQKGCPKTKIW